MTTPLLADALANLPLARQKQQFTELWGHSPLLIEAEPGAGKSTLAPLWALELVPSGQAVWLIQPRILATRAVAQRLAQLLDSPLGNLVGYQVPFDRVIARDTRLQVMTPGIFLQRLLADPELSGVGAVILDEVHERSVDLDLAWAWLQESQILREDLTLLLMTATPDPRLRQQIDLRLVAPGRQFPVTTDYLPPRPRETLAGHVLRALMSGRQAARTVLVFLPGWHAIEDCAQALEHGGDEQQVYRLHSRVSTAEQSAALNPASGPRIILATNVAETSLTVPDVTLVIDSGLSRTPQLDTATGAVHLRTTRISQANADQRRGRAGRVQAGQCIRLWADSEVLPPTSRPEITRTDALPLALRLAHWGTPVHQLNWLDRPSPLALAAAREQLAHWRLLDGNGNITVHGRQVADLGTHPRIAALLQASQEGGDLPTPALDLALAMHFAARPDGHEDWLAMAAKSRQIETIWQHQARRWQQVLGVKTVQRPLETSALINALADRIGHRQASGRYALGQGASVLPASACASEWACFPVIVAGRDGHTGPALPVQLSPAQQRQLSRADTQLQHIRKSWYRVTTWRLGDQILDTQRHPVPDAEIPGELIRHLQHIGDLHRYTWPKEALDLLHRARLAQAHQLLDFPDLAEAALMATLDQWLLPFLDEDSNLARLPWKAGLEWYLGYDQVKRLKQLLPDMLTLASGRRCAIDYEGDHAPKVKSKLQDFFGTHRLHIAEGQLAVTAYLLSPAQRPLAVTADLASFWHQVYPDVRKEMRGRYPKHDWPEVVN